MSAILETLYIGISCTGIYIKNLYVACTHDMLHTHTGKSYALASYKSLNTMNTIKQAFCR